MLQTDAIDFAGLATNTARSATTKALRLAMDAAKALPANDPLRTGIAALLLANAAASQAPAPKIIVPRDLSPEERVALFFAGSGADVGSPFAAEALNAALATRLVTSADVFARYGLRVDHFNTPMTHQLNFANAWFAAATSGASADFAWKFGVAAMTDPARFMEPPPDMVLALIQSAGVVCKPVRNARKGAVDQVRCVVAPRARKLGFVENMSLKDFVSVTQRLCGGEHSQAKIKASLISQEALTYGLADITPALDLDALRARVPDWINSICSVFL